MKKYFFCIVIVYQVAFSMDTHPYEWMQLAHDYCKTLSEVLPRKKQNAFRYLPVDIRNTIASLCLSQTFQQALVPHKDFEILKDKCIRGCDIASSNDGRYIALDSCSTPVILDRNTRKEYRVNLKNEYSLEAMSFDVQQYYYFIDDGSLYFLDHQKNNEALEVLNIEKNITTFVCHPSRENIYAVGFEDGTVAFYKKKKNAIKCFYKCRNHRKKIVSVVWNPACTYECVSMSKNNDIIMWNIQEKSSTYIKKAEYSNNPSFFKSNIDFTRDGSALCFLTNKESFHVYDFKKGSLYAKYMYDFKKRDLNIRPICDCYMNMLRAVGNDTFVCGVSKKLYALNAFRYLHFYSIAGDLIKKIDLQRTYYDMCFCDATQEVFCSGLVNNGLILRCPTYNTVFLEHCFLLKALEIARQKGEQLVLQSQRDKHLYNTLDDATRDRLGKYVKVARDIEDDEYAEKI